MNAYEHIGTHVNHIYSKLNVIKLTLKKTYTRKKYIFYKNRKTSIISNDFHGRFQSRKKRK